MVRSGKSLVILLAAAALVGCSVAEPAPLPPAPAPTVARACPEGLGDALAAHLATQPMGDRIPDEVVVTEFPEQMGFSSPLAEAMSSCIVRPELRFGADWHFQIYGIVTDFDETQIVAQLADSGFEQTFPDTEPGVWETASRDESISLYPDGSAGDFPALGFPGWSDYLEPGDVVVLGNLTM